MGWVLLLLYTVFLINLSYQEGLTIYPKIVAVAIIGYAILITLQDPAAVSFPGEFGFLVAWFLWALFASLFANNIDLAFEKITTLAQVFAVSVAIYVLAVRQGTLAPLWFALIAAALVACALTYSNPEKYIGMGGRIAGPLGNANLFGVVLVAAMSVSIAYSVTVKSIFFKIALVGAAIALFYMIAETGSRKSMIGSILVVVAVLAILLNSIRKAGATKFLIACAAGLIIVAGGITYLASSRHADRLENVLIAAAEGDISGSDNSLQTRLSLIQFAFEQAADNPLIGTGLDNFRDIDTGLFNEVGTYSHSNYLEIAVSTGIPGLILYCSVYVLILLKLFRLRFQAMHPGTVAAYAICTALILTIVSYDFAMVSYYDKVSWLILSAIIAQLELFKRNPTPESVAQPARDADGITPIRRPIQADQYAAPIPDPSEASHRLPHYPRSGC